MSLRTVLFTNKKAPCGKFVGGENLRDRDEECLLSDEMFYQCGCQTIRHEYHDGAVSLRVVRHDGTVVMDELISQG